jgi:acyl-coenzyme A thioesterase PaaI-like protein
MSDADRWREWLLEPEDGVVAIEHQDLVIARSYVSGPESALSVRYYRRPEACLAKVVFGPGTQGPPGAAHGGAIAALFDEVSTWAAWSVGMIAVGAELSVRYHKMVPIPGRAIAEAVVDRVEGRKVYLTARLEDATRSDCYAEARATFVQIDGSPYGGQAELAVRIARGEV